MRKGKEITGCERFWVFIFYAVVGLHKAVLSVGAFPTRTDPK